MPQNPLWYPLDFANRGEAPDVLDAIAQINTEAVATAINARGQALHLQQDIIKNQNRNALAVQSRMPFTKIGQVEIPVVIPPPPPIPQPTILVTPKKGVVRTVQEGTPFNQIEDATITVTALNDDLTIYGVMTLNRVHWTLQGPDGVQSVRDPLASNFDLDNFPVVIPKNTWKAFGIKLNPREGTIPQTSSFLTNEVVFIISDATNIAEDSNLSVTYHAALIAHPEYANLTQEELNTAATVSVRGTIVPLSNPGSAAPDTRVFPAIQPIPPAPPVPLAPKEPVLGAVGYLIGGGGQENSETATRQMTRLDFFSEIISAASDLSVFRQWSAAAGTTNNFYVFGGSGTHRASPTDFIDCHEIASDTSIRIGATLDQKLDLLAAAPADNNAYIFGGDAALDKDPGTSNFGSVKTIRSFNLQSEDLSVLGVGFATPKSLVNCATGDRDKILLFGGGERIKFAFAHEFYDHLPVTTWDNFLVATETLVPTAKQILPDRAWRLASAGNRDYVYLAGGMVQNTSRFRPNQTGLSSDKISRYSLDADTVTLLGETLDEGRDSLAAFGGSKQIYFGGGYTSSGAYFASRKVSKLSNLEALNSETLVPISSTLSVYHGGGTGVSDYSAGH